MTQKQPASGIYRIRNLTNGRVYIGQTSNLSTRWNGHRHRLRARTHDNQHLQSAWNFYGETQFVYEIMKLCPVEALDAEETAAIAAFAPDMIYNVTEGGGHTTRGVKFSKERRIQHSRLRGGKPFFGVNLTTGEITRYEHTGEAAEADKGFSQARVSGCLNGHRKVHRGHSFHYEREEAERVARDPQSQIPMDPRSRPIERVSIATGEVKRYERVSDVRADGINRPSVIRCLAGKMFQTGGYTWRYADGKAHVPMPDGWRENIATAKARAVEGTGPNGEKLVFASMKDAAAHFGGVPSAIHKALTGGSKSSFRYTWRYVDHERKEGTEVPSLLASDTVNRR